MVELLWSPIILRGYVFVNAIVDRRKIHINKNNMISNFSRLACRPAATMQPLTPLQLRCYDHSAVSSRSYNQNSNSNGSLPLSSAFLVFALIAGHTMASMAALVLPAVAPAVARDYGIAFASVAIPSVVALYCLIAAHRRKA